MMKAGSTSETLVSFYETTCCNIPEERHLHICHCENLKAPYCPQGKSTVRINHCPFMLRRFKTLKNYYVVSLKKLLRHVPEQQSEFYNKIINWKITKNDDPDVCKAYSNVIGSTYTVYKTKKFRLIFHFAFV
jgi:hypothetical protein